jgi:hypothetical protein
MKTYTVRTALALLLGLASLAQAAQLVSPPLPTHRFATNLSDSGTCRVRNVGTQPVTVTVSIFSNNEVVPIVDFCQSDGDPRALAAGESCYVLSFLPDDSFAACTVTAQNVRTLRATFEANAQFNTIVAADLR